MCTGKRGGRWPRVETILTRAREHAVSGLIVVAAGLVALNLALLVTVELSAVVAVALGLSLVSVSLAGLGALFLERECNLARAFEAETLAFRQLISDHFLVAKVDPEGRILEANENFLALTGFTPEELASRLFGEERSAGGVPEIHRDMWEAVHRGRTWSGEFCEFRKDGAQLWVKAIVVPWHDAGGNLACMTTIGVDVSEQRNAELQLKHAHARLEAFIKHAPAAVAMFDTDMRYVAHTDRWLRDYDLDLRSLVGLGHYDVFPEIPQRWKEKHQRVLAGAMESCDEERFQRQDGSENILRWEVRPWYLPDRSVGGMIMLTEEISERKTMQDELWKLVKLDSLTGMPNRIFFNESLRSAIVKAEQENNLLAVVLIDLDNFKEVNDTLGHDAGDDVLSVVARRLEQALGRSGSVARLSGDEFAALIPGPSVAHIETLLARVSCAVEEPIKLANSVRCCSASIGFTVFPHEAADPGDLLKNADLALYRSKSLGSGRISRFTADLREAINQRVELQEGALDGLKRGEFLLYFQPIVAADSAEPLSFEALLRWNHPIYGVLSPGAFAEVLQDPRVALGIGERVVDLALEQAAAWQAEGLAFHRIAINVTSADLSMRCFASHLEARLAHFGVAPEKICIEVTEQVFLGSEAENVGEALELLGELGVEIALDDFGTGYASLSHIKAFPINRLKIDRSFVSDMGENNDSLSIVQAIVQLGHSLGLAVTAEGVETEEQRTLLTSMGCGRLQGFYFSRPVPASDLAVFFDSGANEGSLVA